MIKNKVTITIMIIMLIISFSISYANLNESDMVLKEIEIIKKLNKEFIVDFNTYNYKTINKYNKSYKHVTETLKYDLTPNKEDELNSDVDYKIHVENIFSNVSIDENDNIHVLSSFDRVVEYNGEKNIIKKIYYQTKIIKLNSKYKIDDLIILKGVD